jgi:hypothetical protein
MRLQKLTLLLFLLAFSPAAYSQRFLTDMMDTTTTIGKGIFPLYEKYDRLRFGGYMQPQFQWAESKGAKSFNGGDFASNSDNRFMLRRGRLRVDYMHFNEKNQPLAFFAFQFDGTERGVAIRDFWGRFYENKLQMFAVTAGMFARPMGYEVNLSSSDRESPERGLMSQTLMKTERDIGFMLTFEDRNKGSKIRWFKVDLGLFNGQGLNGTTDYDDHKDLIGRFSVKPRTIKKLGWIVSGSASAYYGGITSQSAVVYKADGSGNNAFMKMDSSAGNIGYVAPRRYYGADVQLKIPNNKGYTEFRGEYIRGQQTATATTSETPGTYPVNSTNVPLPLYARSFDGAYFYFLQHLGSNRLQLVLKYDWYDPNKKVKGKDITAAKGFTPADIRYDTYGGGLVYYINAHVKATLYYDVVINEETDLAGYTTDLKDNVFTCRLQYRF